MQLDKEINKVLSTLDDFSPYATFLHENTLSTVTGWIDTGSLGINAICSGSLWGGIPKNRLTVLAGESLTGKTLLLMRIMANAQKEGLYPVIFDSENAFDPESAKRVGVDPTKVKYVPCMTLEETRNGIYNFLNKVKETEQEGKFIIFIDSLTNMLSEIELKRMDKDNVAPDMGTKARAMKSLLQVCVNMGTITKTTIVASAWVYDDPASLFPSLEKNIPGGKAIKYLPSLVLQLARRPVKDDGGKTVDSELVAGQKNYSGVVLRALTVKNRLIRQYLEFETYLSFTSGLDRYYGLIDLAIGLGIIQQNGPTYSIGDTKLGYFKSWRKNTELWEKEILPKIEEKIKKEWQYSTIVLVSNDDK
jgi:RecA/RadA recombinase